jgi:hypothetical protein
LKISQSTTRTNGVKQFTSGTPLPDTQPKKKKKKKKKQNTTCSKKQNKELTATCQNNSQTELKHKWQQTLTCGAETLTVVRSKGAIERSQQG